MFKVCDRILHLIHEAKQNYSKMPLFVADGEIWVQRAHEVLSLNIGGIYKDTLQMLWEWN